ncbi:DNA polymerase theta, partial [Fragariocoptes setiger]
RPRFSTELDDWGLPPIIVGWLKKRGIGQLFDWQVECLCKDNVLDGANLVYSAPTSAGKTLVADFLMIKQVLERRRKALLIQPFISVAREKATTLKSMLRSTKARVGSFCGSYYTPGGLTAVSIAVCTIEKANNIVNKLLLENRLSELGIVVVDELHNLGDPSRGYLLELLLTKIIYHNRAVDTNQHIQIVGLSATLPNLQCLAHWLNASLHITEYRPVPLHEKIKIGTNIYDAIEYTKNPNAQPIQTIDVSRMKLSEDPDNISYLCIETILDGHSVLVFCESRRDCETMSHLISKQIKTLGNISNSDDARFALSQQLRERISREQVKSVLTKLKECPAGLDSELRLPLSFGVAFHHAGLTTEEREIIEDGFRSGCIRALMATSTLSSGVNLPARRVIIKSPMFLNEQMSTMTYRQMIGRAGRKGKDTFGESVLVCNAKTETAGKKLIASSLKPVTSCLGIHFSESGEAISGSLKKALLEVIANGTARAKDSIIQYVTSTYWLSDPSREETQKYLDQIQKVLGFLVVKKFVDEIRTGVYKSTRLGNAVLNSGLSPDESLLLLQDLTRARDGFCLTSDLHIIYQVTPNNLSQQLEIRDWLHYSEIWHSLDDISQFVGKRVGIEEGVIARRSRGYMSSLADDQERVYRRFRVALALNDLVNEVPMARITSKYKIPRAQLQTVQRSTAQFAGVMAIFCHELGYSNIAALMSPLESRLNFSCQRELLDLVRLNISRPVARALYDNKFHTVIDVARGDLMEIEFAVASSRPFKKNSSFRQDGDRLAWIKQMLAERDNDKIWVPELTKTLTTFNYAKHLVDTAKGLVEIELGFMPESFMRRQTSPSREEPPPKRRDQHGSSNNLHQNGVKNSETGIDSHSSLGGNSTSQSSVTIDTADVGVDTKHNRSYVSTTAFEESTDPSSLMDLSVAGVTVRNTNTPLLGSQVSRNEMKLCNLGQNIDNVDKFLDRWRTSTSVSLKFRLDSHQAKDPIGAKVRHSRRNRLDNSGLIPDHIIDDDYEDINDDEYNANDSGQETNEGLPLQLEIDNQKHVLTHMYACFDNELCVYMADTSEALEHIKSNINPILSMSNSDRNIKMKLYTDDIVITYKVLYAAFGVDYRVLSHGLEWHGFDVAWWMINNCPLRERRTKNYKIGSILDTDYGKDFHHLLDPSYNPRRRKSSIQIVRHDTLAGTAAILSPLIIELCSELDKRSQLNAYAHVEVPSRIIMAHMMVHGIGVSLRKLTKQLKLYEDIQMQLEIIARARFAKANQRLSLASHRDVARVLYDELNLREHLEGRAQATTSRGRDSTKSEVLSILSKHHPFPKLVQDYRRIGKAIEALQSVSTHARFDCELDMTRVMGQCDFWQLTGRVSMHSPDLFLINRDFCVELPAHNSLRNEERVDCEPRRCFVPYEDWTFVSADYSQLELRLLAHFSADANLLSALNNDSQATGGDVFRTMASQMYGIDDALGVSVEQRQHAKQICYGIIYGMGTRTLANKLGVETDRAKEFDEKFHAAYPKICEFRTKLLEECQTRGYVESIMGRRRTVNGLDSGESETRSRAQRIAVNTRIQSSASDIIKLAMNEVDCLINERFANRARLVLEMHDELIYEVHPSNLNELNKAKMIDLSMNGEPNFI